MSEQVTFEQGDATALAFDGGFDAAMSIHVAMTDKGPVYTGVRRALRPGRVLAVYDVLQGEGGEVLFPVPWAREPSSSHLTTPDDMRRLLEGAGFKIESEQFYRRRQIMVPGASGQHECVPTCAAQPSHLLR